MCFVRVVQVHSVKLMGDGSRRKSLFGSQPEDGAYAFEFVFRAENQDDVIGCEILAVPSF